MRTYDNFCFQLQKSDDFCKNLEKSMNNWKIAECLDQAAKEVGFAPVCYYCEKEKK